jgi:hypothetical protein
VTADIAQKIDVIEVGEPFFVVFGEERFPVELEEFVDLRKKALGVRVDFFIADDLPHARLAGRIADARGPAAHEHDHAMPRLVQVPHREIRDHVADVERGPGGIATLVERDGAFVHELREPVYVGALLDEAAFL